MVQLIAPHAAARGDAPALVDGHGRTGWDTLNRRCNRLVRLLQAHGLGPGQRIALYAGNSRQVFELMLAASHLGLGYVPVNWHLTADELAHILADAGVSALFTDSQHAAVATAALQRVPAAGARLALAAQLPGADALPPGLTELEAALAGVADDSEPPPFPAGEPMFYTSGTTGRPKGVLRDAAEPTPLDALRRKAQGTVDMLQLPAGGTTLLCGPYHHSGQWAFSFYPLLCGLALVVDARFDAARTLALIDAHRVTNLHLVPTQFVRLLRLDAAQRAGFRGDSLVRVWHGAAPCPQPVKRAMIDWWGPCIHEYYGSTEGTIVSGISSAEWLARPGSVGRADFRVAVTVRRDDGQPAAPGEAGTLYLSPRAGGTLGLRYHNDPDKTRAAYDGRGASFTTGDVGWLDADGYLYLTDRKIDMIISGGVNIYPAEVEAVLQAHPAVADVAVIGVPDAEFGERVQAVVQPVPGQAGDAALAEALTRHCRQHLAGYKRPRGFEFRDSLPRTETGKLLKRVLREAYRA